MLNLYNNSEHINNNHGGPLHLYQQIHNQLIKIYLNGQHNTNLDLKGNNVLHKLLLDTLHQTKLLVQINAIYQAVFLLNKYPNSINVNSNFHLEVEDEGEDVIEVEEEVEVEVEEEAEVEVEAEGGDVAEVADIRLSKININKESVKLIAKSHVKFPNNNHNNIEKFKNVSNLQEKIY